MEAKPPDASSSEPVAPGGKKQGQRADPSGKESVQGQIRRRPRARCKVLVVDDHAPVARAIAGFIREIENVDVCGIAHSYSKALVRVETTRPDLVLMDIDLNETRDGIDAAQEIQVRFPQTNVLLFSAYADPKYVLRATKVQVHGYILKGDSGAAFVEAVDRATQGKQVFSPTEDE